MSQRKWTVRYSIIPGLAFDVTVTAAHPQTAIERGYERAVARIQRLGDNVQWSGQHSVQIIDPEQP